VAKVTTGLRGAASFEPVLEEDLIRPKPLTILPAEEKRAFPTKFQSRTQHYIVTLNIRTLLPDGMMKDGKFNVLFEGGYVDIETKKYQFSTEKVSKALQECEGYGIGKSFWNAAEFAAKVETDAFETFLESAKAIAADPSKRDALRAVLGDSFKLEKQTESEPGVPASR